MGFLSLALSFFSSFLFFFLFFPLPSHHTISPTHTLTHHSAHLKAVRNDFTTKNRALGESRDRLKEEFNTYKERLLQASRQMVCTIPFTWISLSSFLWILQSAYTNLGFFLPLYFFLYFDTRRNSKNYTDFEAHTHACMCVLTLTYKGGEQSEAEAAGAGEAREGAPARQGHPRPATHQRRGMEKFPKVTACVCCLLTLQFPLSTCACVYHTASSSGSSQGQL